MHQCSLGNCEHRISRHGVEWARQMNTDGLIPGAVKTQFRIRAFPAEDASVLTPAEDVAQAVRLLLDTGNDTINDQPTHGRTFHIDELRGLFD